MEKDIIAFKTKIYPTKTQKDYFNKCFGIRRFAWNWALENWETYKSWTKLDKAWNHSETLKSERPYLYEVNSMAKTVAFKDINRAWNKFFKEPKVGKPKFKSKKKDTNRFSMFMKSDKGTNKTIKFNGKWIDMNGTRKLGRLKFKSAENLEFLNSENIRIAEWTISERAGDYYISIAYERTNHINPSVVKLMDKIGIDGGMKTMMTSWDGLSFNKTNLPKKILELEYKMEYLQRKQSKKVYGSKRYNSFKKQINKLYLKIANIKKDFFYKQAVYLAKTYNQINLETFSFQGTMNFTKGRRKLYRLSISMFIEILERKCKEFNTSLNLIKGEPTTQTCSCCGNRYRGEEKLNIGDRIFECSKCGLILGRDENASKNIYSCM